MIQDVAIETENIKLDQFLKWSGAVSTGGEAKIIISEGSVKVNEVIETRRGKVLNIGDIVEIKEIGSFKVIPSNQ